MMLTKTILRRSINIIKSLGCTEKGVLRSNKYKPNREKRNSMILGILKDEWFGSVEKRLKDRITNHSYK